MDNPKLREIAEQMSEQFKRNDVWTDDLTFACSVARRWQEWNETKVCSECGGEIGVKHRGICAVQGKWINRFQYDALLAARGSS